MKVTQKLKEKAGIYRIYIKDRCYVGSSKNLYTRLCCHFTQLRANTHHSKYMQRVFNKYGEDEFSYEILEILEYDEEVLRKKELECIEEYDSVFNSTTPITYNHSEEMKERISETLKEKYKSGEIINPRLGKGQTLSIYNKIGKRIKENILVKEAVEFLGLSNRSVVNNRIRDNRYLSNQKFILIGEDKTFTDYIDYLKEVKGSYVPVFKVYKDRIEDCSLSAKEKINSKILKSENLYYYSKKNKCYYTYLGLINKTPYWDETLSITTEQKR